MARTLYKERDRFIETYWERYGRETYRCATRRAATRMATSGSSGRLDDVINVSGHRLSTMEVESALVSHEGVAEAAVIGEHDETTGQAICAFVTLERGNEPGDEMVVELREHGAEDRQAGATEADHLSDDLPKTFLERSCAVLPATSPRATRSAT